MQPGTAPGAAPRRAGRTRRVRGHRLVSKYRLGDDQQVTGQQLREMGGCRRALVFRFWFWMGHCIVMVLEGEKKGSNKWTMWERERYSRNENRLAEGAIPDPFTKWSTRKLSVGLFLASAMTPKNLKKLVSSACKFPKQSCEGIIVLFIIAPFFLFESTSQTELSLCWT